MLGDTSFWLALTYPSHPLRPAAQSWFEGLAPGSQVLFCRATQQSFLRLLTTASVARAFDAPALTNKAAWSLYSAFLKDARIGFAEEPVGVQERWHRYALRDSASPKLWMDAYLAAFARELGCPIVTGDSGFKQFEGLETVLLR